MGERDNTGVLLDVDGTLVDTAALHFRTWQQAFREQGVEFSADDFSRLFGLDPIPLVVTRLGCAREKASAIADRKAGLFRDKAADVKAFPGAAALLAELRRNGLLIALISSTTRADVENYLLPCIGPRSIVDLVVTGDMVARGKPQPDTLNLAMETLGVAPGRGLTAGDTIFDVAAGVRAGVTVVGMSADPTRAKALKSAGAHYVARDLALLGRFIAEWTQRLTNFASGV
jgi:beta-phosphoglucomutase-like phosphatase (HAD superfamily)